MSFFHLHEVLGVRGVYLDSKVSEFFETYSSICHFLFLLLYFQMPHEEDVIFHLFDT